MLDPIDPQNVFDAYYYQHGCGAPYIRNETWLAFFQEIADRIIEDLQPKTVLDAGCALGFLVEGFRNRGVEAWGIDISEYAIANVHESIQPYCRVGSVIEPFERKYDLIVTIEVAEHMQPLLSKQMIANLCAHTDNIIFTSTPFDYKETTHFNVQPPEVWSREFARHGFFRDVDYDSSYITAWAVRYCRKVQPIHQTVYDYERRFWLLNKENSDLRQLSNELRDQTRGMDQQIQADQNEIENVRQRLALREEELQNIFKQREDFLQSQIANLHQQMAAQLQQNLELNTQSNEAILQSEKRVEEIQNIADQLRSQLEAAQNQIIELQTQVNELQHRWEALESTRTWKVLTTLYKIRKSGEGQ